jgi:biotin operon repressor
MTRQAAAASGQIKKSSVTVLIPKALRAEWVDVMALDPTLSNSAFRVACVIGSYFNKHRGDAYPSIETLARVMGASERTVWAGVKELEERGYLIVKRRSLGSLTRKRKDGTESEVKLAGGRGVSNTYTPAFERSHISATITGSKVAERCDLYWSERSQKSVSKVATDCDPTLNLPSEGNPTLARGPSSPNGLGPAGEQIRRAIGDANFRSWISKLAIVGEADGVVTLSAPTGFHRDRVVEQFEFKILEAWQSVSPSVTRIVIVKKDAAA